MNQPLSTRLFPMLPEETKMQQTLTIAGGFLRNDLHVKILIAFI